MATSSRLRRRWRAPDGTNAYHVLDPRTRRPAVTDLVAVTVHAADAWTAEVLAKAALIAGSSSARALLERAGVGGVLVHESGSHEIVGPLEPEVEQ